MGISGVLRVVKGMSHYLREGQAVQEQQACQKRQRKELAKERSHALVPGSAAVWSEVLSFRNI